MRRPSFTRLSLFQQPLIYLALAFIGGLLLGARFPLTIRVWFAITVAWWLAALVCLLKRQMVAVLLLLGGCAAAGGLLWVINEAGTGPARVRSLFERGELSADEPIEIIGMLNESPELAPDRIYLSIEVERCATLGRELRASGAVQIMVPFNDQRSREEYDQLALDYGARIRLRGNLRNKGGYRNPGAPNFDQMLEFRGYDASGWVKSPSQIERIGEGKRNAVLAWLYRFRAREIALCLRSFKDPTSGVLVAALFGNRYFLSHRTAEIFRAGGTIHLLVISGSHVAMIALVVLWLARRLSRSSWFQHVLVMIVMWAYALMVGAQPSVTRAVVMLNIVLIGKLLFRASLGANTLAASAIVLLVWQPRDLFNPAFQLSFLTVLMIVALTVPLYQRLKRIGEWQPSAITPYPPRVPNAVRWLAEVLFWNEREFRREMSQAHVRFRLQKVRAARWLNRWRLQWMFTWIAVTLFTTTAVQVGLLPLMLVHFHRVSIVSPLANVVEGLLVALLMLLGAVYLLIEAIIGAWAVTLAGAVNAFGWLTVKASEPLLAWRKASIRVPDWGESQAMVFTAYFAAVLLLIILANEWNPLRKGDEANDARRKITGRIAAAAASGLLVILSLLLVVHPFPPEFERGRLSVTFLDVGQGDSMLLVFPQGRTMLLDSGGKITFGSREEIEDDENVFVADRIGIAEAAVMPYLWHRGIKRLDWIAASHGDADHVEGFARIARSFEIGGAVRATASSRTDDLFDQAVQATKLPVRRLKRGEVLEIDGATIEVLSPDGDDQSMAMSDNNQSLVLRVRFGQRSFLLTGDIEKQAEARLVAATNDLRADVLKVAHHGSKTSSTAEFLARVKPQHAVISVAYPSIFGHPHAEVIERLRESNAHIWQTSQCGAITISTNGSDLRVQTYVKCE
ncbi:MAG: ComEC/Rec2 family competence protein [Acidobacteriota bacterium]